MSIVSRKASGERASSTVRHTLKLKLGRVAWVEVTETPHAVYITIGGDKGRLSDAPRFAAFMWPIVDRYAEDDRPIEFDAPHLRGGTVRLHTLGRTAGAVRVSVERVERPARANA